MTPGPDSLPPIEWTPALATGHGAIDADHRIIVDLHNDLAHALDRKTSLVIRRELVDTLVRFWKGHMEREERLMDAIAAQEHDHRAQHAACRAELDSLLGAVRDGDDAAVRATARTLRAWILAHIGDDAALARAVRGAARPRAA